MNVNTMRTIDKYLGIPLCVISTIICKIFFRFKKNVCPKKVLFVELSEMGSVILADPAMRRIKEKYDAELYFLIFEKNKPSLELLQTVPNENIFTIRLDWFKFIVDTLRFFIWSRRKKIDTAIDLELFSRYTAILTGFSGANNRIGFYRYHNEGLYRGEMLTHRVAYNQYKHISKNFMALVNVLEENFDEPYSKLLIKDSDIVLAKAQVSETDKEYMRKMIDEVAGKKWRTSTPRLLLINITTGNMLPQRCWTAEHFVSFMKIMLDRYKDMLILLIGEMSVFFQAEQIKNKVNNPRCLNFTVKTSLKEMLWLYSISSAMLTSDSGHSHFSAITDLPTAVIFGPETPLLYGSLGNSTPLFLGLSCSPCVSAFNHRKTTCVNNICTKKIEPEYVANVISGILESSP